MEQQEKTQEKGTLLYTGALALADEALDVTINWGESAGMDVARATSYSKRRTPADRLQQAHVPSKRRDVMETSWSNNEQGCLFNTPSRAIIACNRPQTECECSFISRKNYHRRARLPDSDSSDTKSVLAYLTT